MSYRCMPYNRAVPTKPGARRNARNKGGERRADIWGSSSVIMLALVRKPRAKIKLISLRKVLAALRMSMASIVLIIVRIESDTNSSCVAAARASGVDNAASRLAGAFGENIRLVKNNRLS